MYHEQTREMERRSRRRRLARLVALALVVLAVVVGARAAQAAQREQGAVALRSSILDAANRCCAVEGSYPSSLQHLEDSYGLVVNSSDYAITYESYAGNVVPTVVVMPR